MKIKFTPSLRLYLFEGLERICQDSPAAARQFRIRTEAELGRLAEFPELPHRAVIFQPYRLFYRVFGKTVWIVAVCHSAQLPAGSGN